MSIGDDYNKYILDKYRKEKEKICWNNIKGEPIMIKDMDDNYLFNTINFIKNKNPSSAWIFIFNSELMRRRKLKINKILK